MYGVVISGKKNLSCFVMQYDFYPASCVFSIPQPWRFFFLSYCVFRQSFVSNSQQSNSHDDFTAKKMKTSESIGL
jgi:hypothetical protein